MIDGKHIALNAHLLSGKAGYRSAGIHGYIYHTLAHLPEAAPKATFTALTGKGTAPDTPALDIIQSRMDTATAPARILWERLIQPGILRHLKPDLHHGMAFSLPPGWKGPSVVTIYDLSFKAFPDRLSRSRRFYLETITADSIRRASRILTISHFIRNEISSHYHIAPDRVDVAYPGVSPQFKVMAEGEIRSFKERRSLPEQYLFYLGTLEPRKNLTMLVRAYAASRLKGQIPLILAGGRGWMTATLFSLIDSLKLTNDVLLPGYVSDDEIALWYNAAEAVVFPSVYEGFGMPVTEAMACGKPVLVSYSSSLPEAAGDAGILLPADDPAAWTEAMERICHNAELRADLAQKGLAHSSHFTWAETAAQVVASYDKCLSSEC